MLATACGGGETAEPAADPAGVEAPTEAAAIPTTAPVPVPADEEPAEDAAAPLTEDNFAVEAPDPNENIVLVVKENQPIVPTFDAPNGNEVTLYDTDPIGGTQWEYPLHGETHFENRLALRVEQFDSTGNWAEVVPAVRPNGTKVWVQTAFFDELRHDYRIEVNVTNNIVKVYKGDEVIVEQLAVTGRESRPTPLLTSYIDEKIPGDKVGAAYGSWVLSIAAFSEAMGEFNGGTPKLALHGTNQPDLMGQYVSSGCVRVPNDIIEFIADNVPVGARVDIVA